jgi:hypothetical protein
LAATCEHIEKSWIASSANTKRVFITIDMMHLLRVSSSLSEPQGRVADRWRMIGNLRAISF